MKKTYQLNDLDCAVCAQKMQDAIAKLDGVQEVSVSYIMQKMTIVFSDELSEKKLMKKVVGLIGRIEPDCEVVL